MAIAAKSPCRFAGCNVLVSIPGHCDKHRKETFKKQKQSVSYDYKERNRFYQRKPWKVVRSAHLNAEPLCRSCKVIGRLVAAAVVDHIVPISAGGADLDDSNLQSLCKSCHNTKTLIETMGGRGVLIL